MLISIEQAAHLLKSGQVVAIPTETVYGLAATINSESAIQAIYALKKRPINNPLIIHVSSVDTILNYASSISPSFLKIILDKINEKNIDVSFLKNALVGADPFSNDLRKYFREKYKIVPLQMYGTAEVGCIAYESKNKNNEVND